MAPPLLSCHSDIAIGTRLAKGSRVVRGLKREVISRCYNLLLRITLGVGFTDAQCGFKAIRAGQARELLPLVEDRCWFFDTRGTIKVPRLRPEGLAHDRALAAAPKPRNLVGGSR